MRAVRVAVIEEHEIFRRGLVGCLEDDPSIDVIFEGASGPLIADVDVAVVSRAVAAQASLPCPIIVCGEARSGSVGNWIVGALPRSTLTVEQLIASVRAGAAGLRIDSAQPRDASSGRLDRRASEVLRLLAEGADTREISTSLRYSERTVKGLIQAVERELGARTRAQAVAEGIRRGLVPEFDVSGSD